ncbi:MAG TPA: aminopeptidase [bacterium]
MSGPMRNGLLLAIALFLSGCSAPYLADTAYHHLRLLARRVPIDTVVHDGGADPRLRQSLERVASIRRFASERLGMTVEDNYATYVAVHGPYVTFNLSACPPDQLVPYQWHFPVVGAVPYKGFFHRTDAEHEERRLRAAGYETYLRGVVAYSTLGWFSDPVLSTMLGDDPYELADLLFHELTHATLFVKGEVAFNESLASFVAEQATLQYIADQEGRDSPAYRARLATYAEERRFSDRVHGLYLELESLYQAAPPDAVVQREALYAAFRRRLLAEDSRITAPGYRRFAELPPNNARLLAYHRYHEGRDAFEALLGEHNGDLSAFLHILLRHRRALRHEPFTVLRQLTPG